MAAVPSTTFVSIGAITPHKSSINQARLRPLRTESPDIGYQVVSGKHGDTLLAGAEIEHAVQVLRLVDLASRPIRTNHNMRLLSGNLYLNAVLRSDLSVTVSLG